MRRVLDWREHQIEGSNSILGFETQGSGSWEVWDRYLTVHGTRAYHIGNICGTCQFFFEGTGRTSRAKSDNVSAQDLVQAMTQGLATIDSSFLEQISVIMPDGEYIVALMRTIPRLVVPGSEKDYFANEQVEEWGLDEWGLPNYPKVKYYRGDDGILNAQAKLYEFVVPLYPVGWLRDERVEEFQKAIRAGVVPTALALSIMDIKQYWDSEVPHWCLAHYLVDGHHKLMAASMEGRPVTILAFIAVKEGISSKDDVLRLLSSV